MSHTHPAYDHDDNRAPEEAGLYWCFDRSARLAPKGQARCLKLNKINSAHFRRVHSKLLHALLQTFSDSS